MKKENVFVVINWIFVAITIIANILSYKHLPDSMVIQINSAGEASNQLSKGIYLIMVPIVLLSISLYTSLNKNKSSIKYFILMTILFSVNIFTLYFNLR